MRDMPSLFNRSVVQQILQNGCANIRTEYFLNYTFFITNISALDISTIMLFDVIIEPDIQYVKLRTCATIKC